MRTAWTAGPMMAVLAFGTAATQAELIIGNLNAPQVSSTVFGGGSVSQFKAVGFTMGADAYFVDRVTLAMDMQGGLGNPVVSIWSGANAPQTELAVLNNPANLSGGGTGNFAFTPTGSFILDSNTTYWIHVRSDPVDGADFNWLSTDISNPPSGPHAAFLGYNFNGSPSSFYNRFEIQGTLVPAPSGVAVLGMIGLAASRRRR
ncbi:MAG: hypothetical protein LAT64_02335 [Phycisphaerales bacterium]|nr:hypothetical protein [Planctomycetota bacterium]MCH8507596.1 hypothetical protein [Phycisphaerales bacterium]